MENEPVISESQTSPSIPDEVALYTQLYKIRRFEETILENFPKGVFSGTTHTYLGQEANAVGVIANIQADDIVFSNHRCHGHYLAYGGDMRALFAELMGKRTGVCAGRGGSQHLHWKNFYSNGVQGGIVPVATGMALAEKFKGSTAVTVVFLGDGTLGEGVVYESLNMASLWEAPIVYVLENNHIAQTTPSKLAVAGDIVTRFEAFGISTRELDSSDVIAISRLANEQIRAVRQECIPRALIIHTHRFGPHSKGDDTRNQEEIEELRKHRDPLHIHARRLSSTVIERINIDVDDSVQDAFEQALADPLPDVESLK